MEADAVTSLCKWFISCGVPPPAITVITPYKGQKDLIKETIGEFHVHKVSLDDAISWGILPEPMIYLIGVDLDNITVNQVFNFNKIYVIDTLPQYNYNYRSLCFALLRSKCFEGCGTDRGRSRKQNDKMCTEKHTLWQ